MLAVARISSAPNTGVTMQTANSVYSAGDRRPRSSATASSISVTTSDMVSRALVIPRWRVRTRGSSRKSGGTNQSK